MLLRLGLYMRNRYYRPTTWSLRQTQCGSDLDPRVYKKRLTSPLAIARHLEATNWEENAIVATFVVKIFFEWMWGWLSTTPRYFCF